MLGRETKDPGHREFLPMNSQRYKLSIRENPPSKGRIYQWMHEHELLILVQIYVSQHGRVSGEQARIHVRPSRMRSLRRVKAKACIGGGHDIHIVNIFRKKICQPDTRQSGIFATSRAIRT